MVQLTTCVSGGYITCIRSTASLIDDIGHGPATERDQCPDVDQHEEGQSMNFLETEDLAILVFVTVRRLSTVLGGEVASLCKTFYSRQRLIICGLARSAKPLTVLIFSAENCDKDGGSNHRKTERYQVHVRPVLQTAELRRHQRGRQGPEA